MIAVAHASLGQVSPGQCHSQGLVGELGRDVRAHRPSRDAPRPDVHHERQVQPTLAGLDVGDVGEPRHVGAANDVRAGHVHRHSRLPKPRQAGLVLRASAAQPAVRHVDIVVVRVAAGQQEAEEPARVLLQLPCAQPQPMGRPLRALPRQGHAARQGPEGRCEEAAQG